MSQNCFQGCFKHVSSCFMDVSKNYFKEIFQKVVQKVAQYMFQIKCALFEPKSLQLPKHKESCLKLVVPGKTTLDKFFPIIFNCDME